MGKKTLYTDADEDDAAALNTHVTFVLDSSGSMAKIEADTTGGFNAFLEDQQDEQGSATVTLFEFNSTVERVYQARPIEEAPHLDDDNYTPGGRTALHDAMATAIEATGDRIEALDEAARPDTVVVVVLTDGKENASETPGETVRDRVEARQEADDWEFLFIGANQDAALTAGKMGIGADKSLDMAHSGAGTQAAYESTSEKISRARQQGSTGGFDEADRKRQEQADDS